MGSKPLKKNNSGISYFLLIPVMIIIGIIPLIVRLGKIDIPSDAAKVWITDMYDLDLFSYNKAKYLVIITVIMVAFFLARLWYKDHIRSPRILIPLYAYSFFVVLSAIMTEHKSVSSGGFPSRYEGLWVLLAYVAVLFVTINIVEDEKSLKIILGTLIASATVIGLIGIFQYFGFDLFRSELGKHIMLPQEYLNANLNFQFGKNTIYSTLFNTNNVGSYAAMLFPLSLCFYLFIKDKYMKILAGVFSCLMFMLWIGCMSIFGLFGGIAAVIFLLAVFGGKVIKEYKSLLIIALAYALLFAVMNYSSNGAISDNSKKVTASNTKTVAANSLKDIQVKNDEIYIITSRNPLKIQYKSKELSFADKSGSPLSAETKGEGDKYNYVINNDLYSDYKISYDKKSSGLQVETCNRKILLSVSDKGIMFVTAKSPEPQGEKIDKIDVKGKEAYGSGRILIWSRSIPLLKHTILWGKGPDTFPFYYPQNDFVGKILGLNQQNIMVDKPHSMYLQMGINTGVLSLICFLAFLLLYYISTIKMLCGKELNNISKITSVGILTAGIGYLVSGVGNDSIVSVAPVFWTLLGVGIAINYNIQHETDKKVLKSKVQNKQ